jgi:hypothetical protein
MKFLAHQCKNTNGGTDNMSKNFDNSQAGESLNNLTAADVGAVDLTTNQTVSGVKTFNNNTIFDGDVGIGTTTPGFLLDVNGSFRAVSITESSSIALKKNIQPISNGLDSILQLTGVTYDRKDTNEHEAGLIAEHVEQVLPLLVSYDDDGTVNGVKYTKMIAYLIEAVKSLKAEIDELKNK